MPPLTRELWRTLEPLLDEALELDPLERTTLVARVRKESPELADELEALLRGEAEAGAELLQDPRLWERPTGTLEGAQVGAYTLVRCIGRGGMGTVWLADRSDGRYEGSVAVKLLNLALVGRAEEEWFAREGRLLARVDHPNIARLLDAGVTAVGQPYLVLEHVTGRPIDRYADEDDLGVEDRIRLCLDVLSAVGAAHGALILHRDIKPSNILVDDAGRVKLLDFGISKLLRAGEQDASPTATGRALTPDWAAPEVILGEPVSTATDVYSIGVLLYVLLSGRHPTGEGCVTAAEHIRAVIEVEPSPLSVALGGRRGDLDAILSKALKKRPEERYGSASAMADDLARFLRHEPVAAHPDSWTYRSARFVRRHRPGILAAALIALTMVGATAFSVRQMVVAERARERADAALRRSRATTAFETLIFRLLEPGGEPLTYRQLLDRGRQALEKEYRGDPVSRIQLGTQFAMNYLRGDEPATADTIIRRTVAIADSLGDPHWQGRTRCELAFALVKGVQPDSAAALVREARAFLERVDDLERGTANSCDGAEAEVLMAAGSFDAAATLFGRVAERLVADGDTATEPYVIALNDEARAYFSAGRIREAQGIVLRILELSRAGSASDPRTAVVLAFNASVTYDLLGELRGRRVFLEEQIALAAADTLASRDPLLLFELAATLAPLEERDSAVAMYGRALERGLDDGRSWAAHLALARIARASGRPADADHHEREAERLRPGVPETPNARAAVAVTRIEAAAASEDAAALRAEVEAQLGALGHTPESRARVLIRPLIAASAALLDAGLPEPASAYAEQVFRIAAVDSLTHRRSGTVGHARLLQARAAVAAGDSARARALLESALPALAFGYGTGHGLHRAAADLRRSLGR